MDIKPVQKRIGPNAYLNPNHFSAAYGKFQLFIDSTFMEINNHKSKYLIIDLRNNKGGYDNYSNSLISFIAKKPFKWNASFTIKPSEQLKKFKALNNDKTQAYFKEILACKIV